MNDIKSTNLTTICVPQSNTLQVVAELGDVAEDRLGLGLNIPLLEYLCLCIKLRGLVFGTLGPLSERLNRDSEDEGRELPETDLTAAELGSLGLAASGFVRTGAAHMLQVGQMRIVGSPDLVQVKVKTVRNGSLPGREGLACLVRGRVLLLDSSHDLLLKKGHCQSGASRLTMRAAYILQTQIVVQCK